MTGPDSDEAALAREFEAQRSRLLRLAYASTGSLAEAGDCVQEAWLRLQRAADRTTIADLRAWLTTTVSRLALDADGVPAVLALTADTGRIVRIDVIRDPAKLGRVADAFADATFRSE